MRRDGRYRQIRVFIPNFKIRRRKREREKKRGKGGKKEERLEIEIKKKDEETETFIIGESLICINLIQKV